MWLCILNIVDVVAKLLSLFWFGSCRCRPGPTYSAATVRGARGGRDGIVNRYPSGRSQVQETTSTNCRSWEIGDQKVQSSIKAATDWIWWASFLQTLVHIFLINTHHLPVRKMPWKHVEKHVPIHARIGWAFCFMCTCRIPGFKPRSYRHNPML